MQAARSSSPAAVACRLGGPDEGTFPDGTGFFPPGRFFGSRSPAQVWLVSFAMPRSSSTVIISMAPAGARPSLRAQAPATSLPQGITTASERAAQAARHPLIRTCRRRCAAPRATTRRDRRCEMSCHVASVMCLRRGLGTMGKASAAASRSAINNYVVVPPLPRRTVLGWEGSTAFWSGTALRDEAGVLREIFLFNRRHRTPMWTANAPVCRDGGGEAR